MNSEIQELESIRQYAKLKNIDINQYAQIDNLINKLIEEQCSYKGTQSESSGSV